VAVLASDTISREVREVDQNTPRDGTTKNHNYQILSLKATDTLDLLDGRRSGRSQ
jgi:hypothetical protein